MTHSQIDSAALQAMFRDPDGPVATIIEQAAYKVENAAKIMVSRPGTGGIYAPGVKFFRRDGKVYRWERAVEHQVSAPGQPPAGDTGMLTSSLHHTSPEDDGTTLVSRVGSDLFYAEYLELGTRYMAPRPFLRPALASADF